MDRVRCSRPFWCSIENTARLTEKLDGRKVQVRGDELVSHVGEGKDVCVAVCVFVCVWYVRLLSYLTPKCPHQTQGSAGRHEREQSRDADSVAKGSPPYVHMDRCMLRPAACGRPAVYVRNARGDRPLGVYRHPRCHVGRNGSGQPGGQPAQKADVGEAVWVL